MIVYTVLVGIERYDEDDGVVTDLEVVEESQAIAKFSTKQAARDYALQLVSDAQENGVAL